MLSHERYCFKAVHHRQLDIHKNHIKGFGLECGNASPAILNCNDGMPSAA